MLHFVTVAVVILAVSCGSAFAVVNVTIVPAVNEYVLRSSDRNVSYRCLSDCGTVLWRFFDYQMVDRDQYFQEGVVIQDQASGRNSGLQLMPTGREFLLDEYRKHQPLRQPQDQCAIDYIYIQCFAHFDNVHAEFGPQYYIAVDDLRITVECGESDTTIRWCRPQSIKESIPLMYTIMIVDVNDLNKQESMDTRETFYKVPSAFICENCEISVLYQSVDGSSVHDAGVETTLTASIPCPFDITEVQDSLDIDFEPSISAKFDQPQEKNGPPILRYEVTLRNNFTTYPTKTIPAGGSQVTVDFEVPNTNSCPSFYVVTVAVCTNVTCQTTSKEFSGDPKPNAMSGEVVYYESYVCLSASSSDDCVEFKATVNGKPLTTQIYGSRDRSILSPIPIAGEDVVFYDCGKPCTAKLAGTRNVVTRDEFPCSLPYIEE